MPGWICCQSPEVKLLSLILMSLGLVFCVVFAFLVYMAAEFKDSAMCYEFCRLL
jgi:heme/copper-type cytochrome/quinol oxidase subunit 2